MIIHGYITASPNKGFILSVDVADTGLNCGLTSSLNKSWRASKRKTLNRNCPPAVDL